MAIICALIRDVKDISVIVKEVTETAVALGSDLEAANDIALALYEALANSSIHGYQRQPGYVEIGIHQRSEDLFVCLRDQAPLFDPMVVPIPDTSLPLVQRGFGGMGIHMMRNFTDELRYQVTDADQNEVILIKKRAFSNTTTRLQIQRC